MTTLGDVWAITAIIVGIAACAWALLMCLTLIFAARSQTALAATEARPWKTLFTGVIVTVLMGGLGFVFLANPLPMLKLVGWTLVLALMAISFAGSTGLVLLSAERLKAIDPEMTPYRALSRGAMLVVLSCIFPILGWFLFAPLIFAMGVGAGLKSSRSRQPSLSTPPLAS